ncbi:uncharacterized protein [Atheta coriaria]|uniref:uncharacterized protein isoform X2 n=1 Tax=Dalotia coriaria TaxID=877792 RepID=UPI0031F39A82
MKGVKGANRSEPRPLEMNSQILEINKEGYMQLYAGCTDSTRIEKLPNLYQDIILEVVNALTENNCLRLDQAIQHLNNNTKDIVICEAYCHICSQGNTISAKMRNHIHSILVPLRFYNVTGAEVAANTDRKLTIEYLNTLLQELQKEDSSDLKNYLVNNILFFANSFKFDSKEHKIELPWNAFLFYIHQYNDYYMNAHNENHVYQVTVIKKTQFIDYVKCFNKGLEMFLKNYNDIEKFKKYAAQIKEPIDKTYWELRDLHTLQRLHDLFEPRHEANYYGLLRILQMCGECVKGSEQTPNMSENLLKLMDNILPLKSIRSIRDMACHLTTIPGDKEDYSKLSRLINNIFIKIGDVLVFKRFEQAFKIKESILSTPDLISMPHTLNFEFSSFEPAIGTLDESSVRNNQLRENQVNRLLARFEFNNKLRKEYNYNLLEMSSANWKEAEEKLVSECKEQGTPKEKAKRKEANGKKFEEDLEINYEKSLKILKIEVEKKSDLGVEFVLIIILKILDEDLKRLNQNRNWFLNKYPTLTGRQLRNHLAHGDPLADILQLDRRTVVYDTANMLIEEIDDKNKRIQRKCEKIMPPMSLLELIARHNSPLTILKLKNKINDHIQSGCIEELKKLLTKAKMEQYEWSDDITVLNLAAGNSLDNVEVFDLVFVEVNDKFSSRQFRDEFGNNMLHAAAEKGNVQIVSHILKSKKLCRKLYANIANSNGDTPFHAAAIAKQLGTFKVLCNSWFSKHLYYCNHSGHTAIHSAIVYDCIDIVDMFLQWNYDKSIDEILGENNHTYLHLASAHNKRELVRYLVEYGSDGNARDKKLQTPLSLCLQFSNSPLSTMLGQYMNSVSEDNPMHDVITSKLGTLEEAYNIAPYFLWTTANDERTPISLAITDNNLEFMEEMFHQVLLDYSEKPYIFKAVIANMCDRNWKYLESYVRSLLNLILNNVMDKDNDKLMCFWGFILLGEVLNSIDDFYIPIETIIRIMLEKINLFGCDDRIIACFYSVFAWCETLNESEFLELSHMLCNNLSVYCYINHFNTLDLLCLLTRNATDQQRTELGSMDLIRVLVNIENADKKEKELIIEIMYYFTLDHEQNKLQFLEDDGLRFAIEDFDNAISDWHKTKVAELLCTTVMSVHFSKEINSILFNAITFADIENMFRNTNQELKWVTCGILLKIYSFKKNLFKNERIRSMFMDNMKKKYFMDFCTIPVLDSSDWLLNLLLDDSFECQYWAAWTIRNYTRRDTTKMYKLVTEALPNISKRNSEIDELLAVAIADVYFT